MLKSAITTKAHASFMKGAHCFAAPKNRGMNANLAMLEACTCAE